MTQFFILLAVEVLGLGVIWFLLKARVRRALELDELLAEARREIRGLSIELNETADRNITLVEDRLGALRELLAEAERRVGVARKELDSRDREREAMERLSRARPLVGGEPRPESAPASEPRRNAAYESSARAPGRPETEDSAFGGREAEDEAFEGPASSDARPEPIRLALKPRLPEIRRAPESVVPPKSRREEALELHRKGFSPELIASRLGATLSEIELLVSLEEGRAGGG